MTDSYIIALVDYAIRHDLLEPCDRTWAINRVLEVMQLDSIDETNPVDHPLHEILDTLTEDAIARGVCEDNQVAWDLFDTKPMAPF